MTRNDGLPRRVYVKHGRYYYVRPDTKWVALTLVKDGLPPMLRALAELHDTAIHGHMMPAIATRWAQSKETAGEWESSMRRNMERVLKELAHRFADFSPAQVTTPIVAQYLKPYLDRPPSLDLRPDRPLRVAAPH